MRIIRREDRGEEVRDIQQRLAALGARVDAAEADTYGPSTEAAVRAFQQRRGLPADGLVGPDTWNELVEAGYRLGDRTLYLREPFFRGDDVRALQRRLNTLGFDTEREDGILGERADAAIREFQRNVGQEPDGIVGADTLAALERLRPPLDGPSRAVVREAEHVSRMRTSLEGTRIAIDPGHGAGDPGHGAGDPGTTGAEGLDEAAVTFALAEALAAELRSRGALPSLLRDAGSNPEPSERARAANEMGADLCVSIHLGGDPDAGAEGATCAYFGTEVTHSPGGQRLAEMIQEELTGRLGLKDGRTHRLAIAMLRETRMPAVHVEPCFITNPGEAQLATRVEFREGVAVAIAAGVERFLGALAETGGEG